jgi:VanZ family protein
MWLAVSLILAATIAVLSLLRGSAWIVRVTPSPLQRVLHVLFYAALVACLLLAQSSFYVDPRVAVPVVGVGALAFGATLERLQGYRPGRFARVSDFMRDGAGVILGVAIWLSARP